MEFVWLAIAVVGGLVWAWMSISQKMSGDKHEREARAALDGGDWEQAVLCYKLAIISRLDSEPKVREISRELDGIYRSQGLEVDLAQVLECPQVLKTLGSGSGNQKQKNELIVKLFEEAGAFLDGLPGPKLPVD